MFTGEDRVFYKCEMCGDEKDEYSLDTYNDVAKAQTYKEWYDNRLKLIMNGQRLTNYDQNGLTVRDKVKFATDPRVLGTVREKVELCSFENNQAFINISDVSVIEVVCEQC